MNGQCRRAGVMLALLMVCVSCTSGSDGTAGPGASASTTDVTAVPEPEREPVTEVVAVPEPLPGEGPNIVVINVDDADLDLLGADPVRRYFPNIRRRLLEGGMFFDDLHVSAPLCGPSRASLFRGQYAHNTGIELNGLGDGAGGPTGSWAEFLDRGYADEEIAVWLQRAGYFTALVGKYHHTEFPAASGDPGFVPPGWHDFRASGGGTYFAHVRFVNGRRIITGEEEFRTDLETADAVEIIEGHDDKRPLFLYIAPFAPHRSADGGPIYPPRYAEAFADEVIPRTPDFNEADLSDKPMTFRVADRLDGDTEAELDAIFRDRLRSMAAVDDLVGAVFGALDQAEMAEDTYVFLTSDNGYQLGHHRQLAKRDAFDRTTRVGLWAAGPDIEPGTTSGQVLTQIDLTATVLDLAGAERPDLLDGVSFAALLHGEDFDVDRPGVLVEGEGSKVIGGVQVDLAYDALRAEGEVYVEHHDGGREYYDLDADPFQLDNRWSQLTEVEQDDLAARLAGVRDCAGPTCRGQTGREGVAGDVDTVTESAQYDEGRLTVRGTARAGAGVQEVRLTIRRVEDTTYWNGTELTARPTQLLAPLTPTGEGTADWLFSADVPEGDYWVGAWAVDEQGQTDPRIDAEIVVGTPPLDPAPMARFALDSGAELAAGRVELAGSVDLVTADRPARTVRLRIRRADVDFGGHWNGRAWVDDANTWVEAEVDGTMWRYAVELDPGRYLVHAYAIDAEGMLQTWDHGRDAIEIRID